MVVVDAGVVADALLDDGPSGQAARRALTADLRWAAPAHLFVEVLSVVRGRALGRKVDAGRAADAVAACADITLDVVDPAHLLPRMWQLRDNLSAYDAGYVAAAEALGCPLLTTDARLARAGTFSCPVWLVAGA